LSFGPDEQPPPGRKGNELPHVAFEVAAISGHTSLSEVARYTRAADQARLARSAMETITEHSSGKPRFQSGKPIPKSLKDRNKK
jgi:hypothetical protein